MSRAISGLSGYAGAPFVRCDLANVSICAPLELGTAQALVIYNSQSTDKSAYPVRVPVALIPGVSASWEVLNATGGAVLSQLLPLTATDARLRYEYYAYSGSTPNGNVSVAWLSFVALGIPAQGFATYFLQPVPALAAAAGTAGPPQRLPVATSATNASISNGILTVTVDPATGRLSSVASVATGLAVNVTQDLLWYRPVQSEKEQVRAVEAGKPGPSEVLVALPQVPAFLPLHAELRSVYFPPQRHSCIPRLCFRSDRDAPHRTRRPRDPPDLWVVGYADAAALGWARRGRGRVDCGPRRRVGPRRKGSHLALHTWHRQHDRVIVE
jgi:hypothetical protein